MKFCGRNGAGYPDPTCNEALYNITIEELRAKRKAEKKAASRNREHPPDSKDGRYIKYTAINTAITGKEMFKR
ncbi:MAG: hypothetical protein LUD77_02365 [Clostridiales bacterium]|nr:hypothetical protein [Clostridiales bacterium]